MPSLLFFFQSRSACAGRGRSPQWTDLACSRTNIKRGSRLEALPSRHEEWHLAILLCGLTGKIDHRHAYLSPREQQLGLRPSHWIRTYPVPHSTRTQGTHARTTKLRLFSLPEQLKVRIYLQQLTRTINERMRLLQKVLAKGLFRVPESLLECTKYTVREHATAFHSNRLVRIRFLSHHVARRRNASFDCRRRTPVSKNLKPESSQSFETFQQ